MAGNGGIKNGIRRAVFADVSNNAARVPIVDAKHAMPKSNIGKENAPQGKSTFLQPAQRPKNYASVADLRSFHQARETEAIPRAAHLVPLNDSHAPAVPKHGAAKKTMIYNDAESNQPHSQQYHHETAQTRQQPTDRKSPRQYRSQPHLKADQPVLRRTQSRTLNDHSKQHEPVVLQDEDVVDTPYVDAVEDLRLLDWPVREVDEKDLEHHADIYDDIDVRALQALGQDLAVAVGSESEVLPIEATSLSQQGVATQPLSEAEEYWDEDEEFYDDQGYTTAHSYRSLGDNTTGGATTVIVPKVTAKIQRELDNAKVLVESRLTQEELDEEAWDVSMVAEYGDEIFDYMKQLEVRRSCPRVPACPLEWMTDRSFFRPRCSRILTIWTIRPRSSGPCGRC